MYIHGMTTVKTRTFKSGNSEAVRLPKEIAFGEGVELIAERSGDVLTLYPAPTPKMTVAEMLEKLQKLPAPSYIETRDTDEIPEPSGL
jgi:antitoxin VapB